MTVSTTTLKASFSGNDSTTAFAYSWKVFASTELDVYIRSSAGVETLRAEGTGSTNYAVSGVGETSGGNVTFVTAPATGETVVIIRDTALTQGTDYQPADPFPAADHENALDKLTHIAQELDEELARAFTYPKTYSGGASKEMPEPVANAYLVWNAAGDALSTSTTAATQFLGSDGSAAAPFYSWSGDVNSGFYRIGADNVGLSLGGTKRVDFATAGTSITGTLTTSGVVSVDDTTDTTSGTSGSIHTDGGLGLAKALWVGTTARTVGVHTHGGNVVSDSDSTDDLGTNSVRWANLYVDAITATDNMTLGGNLTITGTLAVNGSTSTVSTTNMLVADLLIELGNGVTGTPGNDAGIVIERGDSNNAFMGWDESLDMFRVGTGTFTGATTGNLSITDSPMVAATFEPSGDTAAADNAAIGYTSTEGLIMTGQGSSYDFVLKNDADGDVARVATGTTVFDIPGSLKLATGATVTGIEDSDTLSSDSNTLLATQQSLKAYIDSSSKAAGISMTWETATGDSDQGVGKVWASASSFTPGSDYTLYFDDVERNSVSINALIDSLDDPTATNSATIYIQEAGTASAGLVFLVNGSITSASTYSKVAVEHVATFGTLTDGDVVGVTIAFSGNDGSGAMSDVVDDSSPTLGGDLDVGSYDITSASNADVDINPHGTGNVVLKTDLVSIGGGSEVGHVSSNGAYDMKLSSNSGTSSGTIVITDAANGAITLAPDGTGIVDVQGSMNSSISSTGKALIFGF